MYFTVHWALICKWAVNWNDKWDTGCVRTLYLILNSNGTNVRCCAGTFCREVYRSYILARRVSFLYSCSSYCELSSLTVRTHTTCICFSGEVNLFVKTVCVNRRTLLALQHLRSQERSLYSAQSKRNIQVETRRAVRSAINKKERKQTSECWRQGPTSPGVYNTIGRVHFQVE